MARETLLTAAGSEKLDPLLDSTPATPNAKKKVAVVIAPGTDANSPVGWQGVATHGDGDTFTSPNAYATTDTAAASKGPIEAIGAKDYAAPPIARALRCDENGLWLPAGLGHAMAGLPLVDPTAGGTVITNSAVETAISAIDASRFGYLMMIDAVCSVVGTNAAIATWTLRDGAAGTILWIFDVPINSPVGTRLGGAMGNAGVPIVFPVPLKTNAINKQFTMQASVATLGTWRFHVNGFRSTR